jgi:hypothetical protein
MNEINEITKITSKNIDSIEVNAYPEILFEAIDLIKDLCVKTKCDYNVLLSMLGLEEKKESDQIEQTLTQLVIKLASTLYEEYDRVNREPGQYLKKLINVLSESTDIKADVLRKTDYRLLLQILTKFIQNPDEAMRNSFLDVNPIS